VPPSKRLTAQIIAPTALDCMASGWATWRRTTFSRSSSDSVLSISLRYWAFAGIEDVAVIKHRPAYLEGRPEL
jgi:hypothetical protein